jgi:hypothetical protein
LNPEIHANYNNLSGVEVSKDGRRRLFCRAFRAARRRTDTRITVTIFPRGAKGEDVMKQVWMKLAAVLAVVLMVGVVNAADAPKPEKKRAGLRGEVVKVDGTNLVISAGKKDAKKEVTVATDDKTVVTVAGNPGKLADLKAGDRVSVTPETGTATKIEVMAPKAGKAPKAPK